MLEKDRVAPDFRVEDANVRDALKGAYALVEPATAAELVIIATGSEVPAAQAEEIVSKVTGKTTK